MNDRSRAPQTRAKLAPEVRDGGDDHRATAALPATGHLPRL
ncbi:hypothetical protein [Paraburkholderia caffeinilytica]